MEEKEKARMTYLRAAFGGMLITGPFSILVGFTGGILALNDRLKLRSMVVGERGDTVYIASEESAIRAIEPELDTLYYPRGGEPVVYRVNQGALPEERRHQLPGVRAPVRQRRAPLRRRFEKDGGRREPVRQLPPVRGPVPHPGAENRQDGPHLPGERQLVPVYWDKLLINASQVTNPSIDPLREPMETKTFLGRKPTHIRRDSAGNIVPDLPPQLELSTPILFSAMSYGSISYNAHACLARAAEQLGIYYNTGEGGLHQDFYQYGEHTIVQVASGRFGVHKDYAQGLFERRGGH